MVRILLVLTLEICTSGNLVLKEVKAVGTYDVTLSTQALAKLAMLNPDYLFDNKIANVGTLTINPLELQLMLKTQLVMTLSRNKQLNLGMQLQQRHQVLTLQLMGIQLINWHKLPLTTVQRATRVLKSDLYHR